MSQRLTMRLGVLLRHEDETGVSGDGVVADIVEFPDGVCVAHWRSITPSTIIFPNVKQALAVHGHHGKTEIIFYNENDVPQDQEDLVRDEDASSSRPEKI